MFEKEKIEAFRSISAPESMRDRVTAVSFKPAEKSKNSVFVKAACAVAACLVLAVSMSLLRFGENTDTLQILVSGRVVTSQPMTVTKTDAGIIVAKMTLGEGTTVPLTFKTEKYAVIEVDGGYLETENEDGTLSVPTEKMTVSKDTEVLWQADASDKDTQLEMTVSEGKTTYSVILRYNAAENLWTVQKKDNA